MHKSALGQPREIRVKQVEEGEASVHDYANYIPAGHAAQKLRGYKEQGAEIIYISSHESKKDVESDQLVLKKYDFPEGEVKFRKNGEEYKDIAEKIVPDILVEDDCESIGGEKEMIYPHIKQELKYKIKSIVVKEFEGIDHLPNDIKSL